MKNVRFGSGFLHVILKLIYQQDYNVSTKLTKFMREISSKSAFSRHVVMACLSKSAMVESHVVSLLLQVVGTLWLAKRKGDMQKHALTRDGVSL